MDITPYSLDIREKLNKHKSAVLWLTGLSGAGKSTIANHIEKILFDKGCQAISIDGDNVRKGLCCDLGFSDNDRTENIRRVAEVSKMLCENGSIVIASFISPMRAHRDYVRSKIQDGRFIEIFVKCSIDECKRRDPKGLYKKAVAGLIPDFTGIGSVYEEPLNPELIINTDQHSIDICVGQLLDYLKQRAIC